MSDRLSRRNMIRQMVGTAAMGIAAPSMAVNAFAQGQGQEPREGNGSRRAMFQYGRQFMEQFSVPGMSIYVAKNGKRVYEHSFGRADIEHAVLVSDASQFRIASVTKPITSVAIFSLLEKGKLNLSDKVFGLSGILGTKYGKPPYKQYVADVTIDNLLTHTSGGWPNDSTDPMFQHNGWDQEHLISWTIENLPLTSPPGMKWAYSNFGYCVLGRVIEAVTGQTYEDYVKSAILAPSGITDMQIAKNKESERFPNEVVYYGQYSEEPYKINVTRMDSHGGWVATTSDLVQFLNYVPTLLKPETIRVMTMPTPAYPQGSPAKYARGWMVREDAPGTWWHNGSLPGSTTIMVRTGFGLSWAALTNTRTEPSNTIDTALDEMVWNMVRQVPAWGA